jgi:metal-responsive CopG/Arc/MetJ family transcriptional regulator
LTISLPIELLEALDQRLSRDHEGRSAVIRRLIEDALWQIEDQKKVERWIRGYTEHPQTEEEFGWHDAVLADERADVPPWE